jgi:hypothetical protein
MGYYLFVKAYKSLRKKLGSGKLYNHVHYEFFISTIIFYNNQK